MVSPGGAKQQCLLIMTIYTAGPGLVLNIFARYAIISSKLSPALAAVNTAAAGALSCGALVFTTWGYLVLRTILL